MKKLIFILFLLIPVFAYAQYRETGLKTESVKDGIVNNSPNYLFGFLNTDNFVMRHSISMSYSAFAGQGVALGMYTNSMFYRLMPNLNIQLDVSVVHSPYSTLGETFQKNISGIYISNAAINYSPWKDVSIHLQYRSMPYGYGGYYSPLYSPFGRGSYLNTNSSEAVGPFE